MTKIRAVFVLMTLLVLAGLTATPLLAQDWPMFGQNISNTANTTGTDITNKNVQKLMPKWTFTAGGDISARAAVVNGVAYFPDWGGNLWALNRSSGAVIWSHQLSDYLGGAAGSVHARATAAVSGGVLYIGTQEGAYLLAINASTGALKWQR